MRNNDTILYNVTGQSLTHRAVQGRPSAVTFAVYRDAYGDDQAPEFSGTATIDTVNTTITVAAGYAQNDNRTITVASATGIVTGRKYLLSGNGQSEWVEPVYILSTTIIVRQPIAGDFATGAALASTYATAAIDDTWVALLANLSDLSNPWPDYRIKWTATIGGSSFVEYGFFDVARENANYSVDIEDVNLRAPGLRDSMPTDYRADNGATLLRSAWYALQADFNSLGLTTESIRDAQFIDEAMILKCLAILASGGWRPLNVDWQAYYDNTTKQLASLLTQHIQASARHPRTDGNNIITSASVPVWRK